MFTLPLLCWAGDGVTELNQICATQTGCASGDTPGFPITLTASGSYRLTSNLQVPDENTHGIQPVGRSITIDFNGFTLSGPNARPPGQLCPLFGTGIGVDGRGSVGGVVVKNGEVRGMGNTGILIPSPTARVERMRVEENCNNGVELGTSAIVIQVQARSNVNVGIQTSLSGIIRDSISEFNFYGFIADNNSILTSSVSASNGHEGISLLTFTPGGGLVTANSVANSGVIGINTNLRAAGLLFNSVVGSPAAGISSIVTPGVAAGIGFNSTSGNGYADPAYEEIAGGTIIGCNATEGAQLCP